jgi:glycerol-3-phosphate dehydrogenase (NAD(P)+)
VATPEQAASAARPAVAVLGSGSWGTALAVHLARAGHRTILWGIETDELTAMARDRTNRRYLPGIGLPAGVEIEHDFQRAIAQSEQLLLVVPSHAFREVLERLKPVLRPGQRVAWATKGFELETGKLPHEVARDVLGAGVPTAVLSGPTFAKEVGAGLPTAMTVASDDEAYAMALARGISGVNFRAYVSNDMIGVEVGGATKNVLAIGAGISDGLGFGSNTRVALITRGLAEMMRLGVALGADKDTFMGLAGLGDLVLTCTDDQSRNRRMGLALAAGKSRDEAAAEIGQVVEGVMAARAVREVARRNGVEMPIVEQIYSVLYEGKPPRDAVYALMKRAIKSETD